MTGSSHSHWKMRNFVAAADISIPGMISHLSLPFNMSLGDEKYRTFFSYRDEYQRAHAGSLDLFIDETSIKITTSRGPILKPGQLGHFDEHGVMPSSVIKVGEKLFLYYIGRTQGEHSPMWYAGIGLAISNDNGVSFERYSPAPIFSINEYDTCLVTAPCVVKHQESFLMFYVSCSSWEMLGDKLVSNYEVRMARSTDGIVWAPDGRSIIPVVGSERNIARPWLNFADDCWNLWYSYAGDQPYRLGRARSEDLIEWHREDASISVDMDGCKYFDTMQCYASLFRHKGRDLMMVNGNRFGRDGFAVCEQTEG